MNVPYAADTRAKGWRFELDYEKIDQSDTWSIAAEVPMAQPALLMMWLVAWKQEPCGSLPGDENVIRAKCRVPAKSWPALRDVLMRGWQPADDGRLYHPTITARVLEMLDYRKKTAERVAKFKLAQREQQAGNALPPIKNDTGTGTGTVEEKLPSGVARKRAPPPGRPDDVGEQVWTDWLALRKAKSAPVNATVLVDARAEASKAGMPFEAFLAKWCARGSQGLEAAWLANGKGAPVNRQLAIEAENKRVGEEWLRQGEPS